MSKNIGNFDKLIRLTGAVMLVILIWLDFFSGPLAFVLMALALILLATSLLGVCPLYLPFGINTSRKSKKG